MLQISIRKFLYNKTFNSLQTDDSELRDHMNVVALANNREIFEIVGQRETRPYMFWKEQREPSKYEAGDIQLWEFRPVDRFGRMVDGPKLVVFND